MNLWFTLVAVIAVAVIALGVMALAIVGLRKQLAGVRREAEREYSAKLEEALVAGAAREAAVVAALHDDANPALFSIRTEVGALSRMTKGLDAQSEEIRARLTAISQCVTEVQRINGRLIETSRNR